TRRQSSARRGPGEVRGLAFDGSSERVLAIHERGARFLRVQGGQLVQTEGPRNWAGIGDQVRAFAAPAKGTRLALAGSKGQVWFYDRKQLRGIVAKDALLGTVTRLAVAPDGRWLACGDDKGKVWLVRLVH